MATFETGSFNPRTTNGSALDFMNINPYATQPSFFQPSFTQQPQQQSLFPQSPWQQQAFPGSPSQQQGAFGFQNPMQNILPMQGSSWQTPFAQGVNPQAQVFGQGFNPQAQMQQPGISPFGFPQVAPVQTMRSAEIRVTLPVHRLIHKPPPEIVQYLTQVVLPVLLDGLIKRSIHPELGLSVSNDLRGECVAEIEI